MTGQTAVGLFSIAVLLGAVVFAFWRARGVKRGDRSGLDPIDGGGRAGDGAGGN